MRLFCFVLRLFGAVCAELAQSDLVVFPLVDGHGKRDGGYGTAQYATFISLCMRGDVFMGAISFWGCVGVRCRIERAVLVKRRFFIQDFPRW